MNKVVKILMDRDGYSKSEAIQLVKETKEELLNSGGYDPDEILMDFLGLEPDYLMDVLDID